MRESKIEKHLVDRCREYGIMCRKIEYIGRSGAPDRMLIKQGVVVFVELKQIKGKVSKLQEIEHKALIAQGANLVVAWSTFDVDYAMNQYFGKKP